jgi:hypothetical protein
LEVLGYITVGTSKDLTGTPRVLEGKWQRSSTSSMRYAEGGP